MGVAVCVALSILCAGSHRLSWGPVLVGTASQTVESIMALATDWRYGPALSPGGHAARALAMGAIVLVYAAAVPTIVYFVRPESSEGWWVATLAAVSWVARPAAAIIAGLSRPGSALRIAAYSSLLIIVLLAAADAVIDMSTPAWLMLVVALGSGEFALPVMRLTALLLSLLRCRKPECLDRTRLFPFLDRARLSPYLSLQPPFPSPTSRPFRYVPVPHSQSSLSGFRVAPSPSRHAPPSTKPSPPTSPRPS